MKKALVLALALIIFFSAGQTVHADSNLIPAIKVAGGWVSVVSYVNTMPVGAGRTVFVHATYQVKNPASLTDKCTHLDGRSVTTRNDLTTTVLSAAGGGVGTVFPAADTIGSALIAPPVVAGDSVSQGFLVLENYDNIGALGGLGTLTSEAIIFNLASGFLYSQRGLVVLHILASPAGFVVIDSPFLSFNLQATPFSAGSATTFSHHPFDGTLARFMFLPPATATTGAYVIALNRIGTDELNDDTESFNLVSPDYNARIRLEARLDLAQAYALGVYNRLEDFRSITQGNEIVCLAQLSPSQLVGAGIDTFIANGGWVNLSPRCWESEVAGVFQVCNGNALGTEFGDAAIIYKVEFATGYGFAVTPQHQQWYAK